MNKISVAVCTYNGEKYLAQQLQSILDQSLPPSEIIICDDGSKDRTIDIIKDLIQESPVPIILCQNPVNLGVVKNFAKTISLCRHEYIALSDQDDVWLPDKLKNLYAFFETPAHKNINMVFANMDLVDEHLTPLNMTIWESINFTGNVKQDFLEGRQLKAFMSSGNFVSGSAVMMRRDFALSAVPVLQREYRLLYHDRILALKALDENALAAIDVSTAKYRVHSHQAAGLPFSVPKKNQEVPYNTAEKYDRRKSRRLLREKNLQQSINYFHDNYHDMQTMGFTRADQWLDQLRDGAAHFETRLKLPGNLLLRTGIVLKELVAGRYKKYSGVASFKTAMADLFENFR